MNKKLVCLILALVMLLPVCFTGCGVIGGDSASTGDATDKANEDANTLTRTLTMFLITERHVYTAEEVEQIKAEKGAESKEYIEAKGVMEAYANVAAEINKITKAKFRTQLLTSFYTIEEYRAVEEIMALQVKIAEITKEAKDALKKFKREQKAMGITDESEILKRFYEKYPDYAEYTEAETVDETIETEVETIVNEYGIKELKYPDAAANQVDIVCVCGYENYVKYVNNGWLASLDSELDGASKAIYTYVNEKFMTSAMLGSFTYGIPNNTAIGEYTYLLLNKELYDFYQYDYEKVSSLSSDAVQDFLKDIAMYEPDYVPITGEVGITNTFFWSLDYEYVKVEGELEELNEKTMYYIRLENAADASGKVKYTYRRITQSPDKDVTYYTIDTSKPVTSYTVVENLEKFADGVAYYVKEADGEYTRAYYFDPSNTYYVADTVKTTYKEHSKLTEFDNSKVYYTKNSDSTYTRVYLYNEGDELYTVESASFASDRFSVLGNVMSSYATKGTLVTPGLFNASAYKTQLFNIQSMIDNNYYDADAINDPTKKFASAVVKGNADLAATYGDDYYMIVLEYPRASADEICQNLFAVSSSSKYLSRAMEIITYITTNSDFRNLIQYGILGDNYNVENVVSEENGKTYPTVKRINSYYMMDIYKTGNTFIAYPEENMPYNVWDYGKLQNADAKYDPMIEFDLIGSVNKIDFTVIDRMAELSAHYAAMLDECDTLEEYETVVALIESELKANKVYSLELVPGVAVGEAAAPVAGTFNEYGIYHVYYDWWAPIYYQDE